MQRKISVYQDTYLRYYLVGESKIAIPSKNSIICANSIIGYSHIAVINLEEASYRIINSL